MTNEIEVFIDIEEDILVVAIGRDSGKEDMYAYRLSNEIDLYYKLIAEGSTETRLFSEESGYFKQKISEEEERIRQLIEYEVYSQEV